MKLHTISIRYHPNKDSYEIADDYDLLGDRKQKKKIQIDGGLGMCVCQYKQGMDKKEVFKEISKYLEKEIDNQYDDLDKASEQLSKFFKDKF